MNDRISSVLAIALLLLVLVSSYRYAQSLNRDDLSGDGRIGRIDSFASNVAVTTFDTNGTGRYHLFAQRMTHYSDTDDVFLTEPRLSGLNAAQPAIQATAHQAVARNNIQTVAMLGNVDVIRHADDIHPAMHVTTDHLNFVPDDDHLWTDAAVHLSYGSSQLDAVGFDYNNVTRRAELMSHVTGRFSPRPKS